MDSSERSPRTDGDLLRRYLDGRDDVALTELITRHVHLVRGVCRRVLGDTPDADDAFQATFLVLIRCGERIRRPQSLAAWLYGVAHRIARRQQRNKGRPVVPVREDQAMTHCDPFTEMAARHEVGLFDAELARLPEKYRAPIVLHHLEGKTQREVAAELQLTESAVDGLLKRGRNELRVRLARRGVVLGVTLAAVQSAQDAVAATPCQPLIETTVQGMLKIDPVLHPEYPKTSPARLAQQEISTMALFQATKITAWILVGSVVLGAAGFGTAHRGLPLNIAGVISSELALAQDDAGGEVAVDAEAKPVAVGDQAETRDSKPENPGATQYSGNAGQLNVDLALVQLPAPPATSLRKASKKEAAIFKALEEPTEVNFVDTPLRDALDYIADVHAFDIVIDEMGIADEGGSTDQQVTLELSGVRLESVLNRMLEPLGLDYVVKDELMILTSARIASEQLELRVYPMSLLKAAWREVPQAEGDTEKMMETIEKAVGGQWQSEGGTGTMSLTPAGLVVRTNQRTHREIENLLEQLRRAASEE